MSYSHCWGFTAVLTLLWCYCCYDHSGTIKITKDSVAPVLLWTLSSSHPPLEEGSALLCLRQLSPILPMTHSESDTSQIYHTHVSRPWGTCECSVHQWRAPTSALFSCSIGVQRTCPGFWTYHRPAGASYLWTVLDLSKMCPGKLLVWYNWYDYVQETKMFPFPSRSISSSSWIQEQVATAPTLIWGLGRDFFCPFWERKVIVNMYRGKARLILRPQNKLKLSCQEIAEFSLCWTFSHHKGSLPGKEAVALPCKNIQHQFGGKGRWEMMIQMLPLY